MYPPDLLKRIEEARERGLTACTYIDENGEEVELHLMNMPPWVDRTDLCG